MNEHLKPITLRPDSSMDIHTTLRYSDMERLFSICKWGLPDVITDEMRDGLQTLVCLCLNPYRSMWSHGQEYGTSTDQQ
jgi:hypothetical protein